MDLIHAILVAIIQGATELFPVSSLGHAVVIPALLHWQLDQKSDNFLPFLVMLHTGTATALFVYFWRDWLQIIRGVLGLDDAHRVREARRVFLLVVIATLPAVLLGFVFNKFFKDLFASPLLVAGILVLNGLMLLVGERMRGSGSRALGTLTPIDALVIGCWQCGALFPGISRSGATILGGVLRGVDHEGAAHFSFLIALPIIVGATVLEVPHLLHASVAPGVLPISALAAVVAGVVAYASTWFLMRYFSNHDRWGLDPFGYYCVAAGLLAAGWLGLAG